VPYPSLYRAKAVSIRSGAVEAFVPQVFGETTITITDALGALPNQPTMGWVFFQAGNPEFPVWSAGVSAMGGGNGNGGGGGVDEVWVGPDAPTGQQEMWFDTNAGPYGTLKVLVDGVWQTAVITSGGGGTGVDEVSVGPAEPTSGTEELWYDTDEGGDLSINYWNTAWGAVGKGTFVAAAISCPSGARTAIASMTCNTVAGRRYIAKLYNNLMTPGIGYMMLYIDGVQRSDAPWANTTQNYNNLFASWAPAENLSTGQHTFTAVFDNQSGGAISLYNDGGWFTLEDMGPITRAAVEPPTAATPVVASGNALGVVAVGSFLGGGGYSLPAGTDVRFTNYLPFTSVVGRRYRMHCQLRVVGATTGSGINFLPHGPSLGGAAWDLWHTTPNYGYANMEVLFDGNGTTGNYWWGGSSTGSAVILYLDSMSNFYIEDVGPNAAPALPIPATPPAWIPLAFATSWAANTNGAGYRKIGDIVYVQGGVQWSGGSVGSGPQLIATLPAGFRPPAVRRFIAWLNNTGVAVRISADTNGQIYMDTALTNQYNWEISLIFSVTP
jgi:hypothetical protein